MGGLKVVGVVLVVVVVVVVVVVATVVVVLAVVVLKLSNGMLGIKGLDDERSTTQQTRATLNIQG